MANVSGSGSALLSSPSTLSSRVSPIRTFIFRHVFTQSSPRRTKMLFHSRVAENANRFVLPLRTLNFSFILTHSNRRNRLSFPETPHVPAPSPKLYFDNLDAADGISPADGYGRCYPSWMQHSEDPFRAASFRLDPPASPMRFRPIESSPAYVLSSGGVNVNGFETQKVEAVSARDSQTTVDALANHLPVPLSRQHERSHSQLNVQRGSRSAKAPAVIASTITATPLANGKSSQTKRTSLFGATFSNLKSLNQINRLTSRPRPKSSGAGERGLHPATTAGITSPSQSSNPNSNFGTTLASLTTSRLKKSLNSGPGTNESNLVPASALISSEEAIRYALASLPEAQRAALVLRQEPVPLEQAPSFRVLEIQPESEPEPEQVQEHNDHDHDHGIVVVEEEETPDSDVRSNTGAGTPESREKTLVGSEGEAEAETKQPDNDHPHRADHPKMKDMEKDVKKQASFVGLNKLRIPTTPFNPFAGDAFPFLSPIALVKKTETETETSKKGDLKNQDQDANSNLPGLDKIGQEVPTLDESRLEDLKPSSSKGTPPIPVEVRALALLRMKHIPTSAEALKTPPPLPPRSHLRTRTRIRSHRSHRVTTRTAGTAGTKRIRRPSVRQPRPSLVVRRPSVNARVRRPTLVRRSKPDSLNSQFRAGVGRARAAARKVNKNENEKAEVARRRRHSPESEALSAGLGVQAQDGRRRSYHYSFVDLRGLGLAGVAAASGVGVNEDADADGDGESWETRSAETFEEWSDYLGEDFTPELGVRDEDGDEDEDEEESAGTRSSAFHDADEGSESSLSDYDDDDENDEEDLQHLHEGDADNTEAQDLDAIRLSDARPRKWGWEDGEVQMHTPPVQSGHASPVFEDPSPASQENKQSDGGQSQSGAPPPPPPPYATSIGKGSVPNTSENANAGAGAGAGTGVKALGKGVVGKLRRFAAQRRQSTGAY